MTKSEAFPIALELLDIATMYINDDLRPDMERAIAMLREVVDDSETKK